MVSNNPFRPGTASVPPLLAGRERILAAADLSLSSHGNNFGSFFVVHGPRGLGKTSLLNEIDERARRVDWATVKHEVTRNGPLLHPLLDQLEALDSLPRRLASRIRAVREEWSEQEQTLDLKLYRRTARRDPSKLPIADQFIDAVRQIISHQSDRAHGLVIGVDEVQNADPAELSVLGPLVQQVSALSDQSLMVALTGLPSLPQHLARAFTYSERWAFHPLDNLSLDDAALALAIPARQAGRQFDVDAVELAAATSRGYPFAIQLIGFNSWNISTGSTITIADVAAATAETNVQLAGGLYVQRWKAYAKLQRAYLAAAAHSIDSPAHTGDIATALGRSLQQLSTTRAALIASGALTSPEQGAVEEAIPGFLDYVRQLPESRELIAHFASGVAPD